MTPLVLVVDPELDVLGDVASRLRALGLEVVIADSSALALERARERHPDAIVLEQHFSAQTGLLAALAADRQLAAIPKLLTSDSPADGVLPRRDPETLARAVYAAIPRVQAGSGREGDFRGDLSQLGVVDLLQLLSMNRRSGALTIATTRGAGEVRLRDGEIIDAVFRRQEGEKALFRLLAEEQGSFAFASGTETALRRIEIPTSALLLEGMRQIDEVRQLRERLSEGGAALAAHGELPGAASELEQEILRVLETPRSLDDLLDDVSESDLDVLHAVEKLLASGHMRLVAGGNARYELTDPERAHLMGAVSKRLSRDGFGVTRLVFAGEARRVAGLGHAAGRLAEAEVPAQSLPLAPVPHILATLQLPEGARLELVGLPLLDELSPLWGLSLPGSAAVVQLPGESCTRVEELARVLSVPLLDASALLGELDETDTQQVAALVRSVLDQLAGT